MTISRRLQAPPSSVPTWVLDIPFEWRPAMSAMGVSWDPVIKESVWRGHEVPDHLALFKAPPLSLGWHRQYKANGKHLEPLTRCEPVYRPRAHQDVAVNAISNAYDHSSPGFLLADEVGVGKTMSAWGFALATPELRTVLIVTTASAQAHWRATVRHAGWLPTHSVIIINYDRLGKLFEEPAGGLSSARKKGKRKRLAKQGQAPTFDLIIFDESHKGKNPTSARSIMMRKLEDAAEFSIWASATAGQNPVELIYLSALLSFSAGEKVPGLDLADFTAWCAKKGLGITKGAFGKITWDHSEADLDRMHEWLFGGKVAVGIRRLPQDISGWPALQRQLYPVDLDAPARKAYATVWAEFLAHEVASQSKPPKVRSAERETNRMRLRQESSWLRVGSTAALTDDLVDQNKKVAVSVAFRRTQDALVEQLTKQGHTVAVIHGEQSTMEKERQRLLFQKGDATAVVFTVEEAISLHEGEYLPNDIPRVLLVHDIRWSAIQMSQIEGRCHRDGKLAPVMWLAADDTVDLDIAETMINKVKGMKALHGDPVGDMAAIEDVLSRRLAAKH